MPTFELNPDSFGAFHISVGQNGTHDLLNINVGTGFSGSITVDSLPADGEIETVNLNLPEGWSVVLQSEQMHTDETPPYLDYSYTIIRADASHAGVLTMRGNLRSGDFPCFTAGTMIVMADGSLRRCDQLQVADLVATRDHGAQALRWIGKRRLGELDLLAHPHMRPIRIRANALGAGMPSADLLVSPQHRVLVASDIAADMFGKDEVLVAAKHLTNVEGIEIAEDVTSVTYVHLLFDQHELVISNGAATESLYAGAQALRSVDQAARNEISDLFPELSEEQCAVTGARMFVTGRQGRDLAAQHIARMQPLMQ